MTIFNKAVFEATSSYAVDLYHEGFSSPDPLPTQCLFKDDFVFSHKLEFKIDTIPDLEPEKFFYIARVSRFRDKETSDLSLVEVWHYCENKGLVQLDTTNNIYLFDHIRKAAELYYNKILLKKIANS